MRTRNGKPQAFITEGCADNLFTSNQPIRIDGNASANVVRPFLIREAVQAKSH